MPKRFEILRRRIASGFKVAFRAPSFGNGAYSGYGGRYGMMSALAGSSYDYNKEAGVRYDNSIVFACLQFIADCVNEAPAIAEQRIDRRKWDIYESDDPDDGLERILSVLETPNGNYNGNTLMWALLLSLLVQGNAYAFKVEAKNVPGRIVGLQYIPHTQIWPYVEPGSRDWITHYRYQVDGQILEIPTRQILHLRNGIDPLNIRLGLAPLHCVLREICTENEAATFSAALLRNGAVPGLVVTPKEQGMSFTPEQADRVRTMIPERLGGERRGDALVLDYPVDVTAPGFTPEQLVLDKVRQIPVARICGVLKISPMVIHQPDPNKTYSNMEAAYAGAHRTCIVPLWQILANQLTDQLMPDFIDVDPTLPRQFRVGYDTSEIQALQEDQDKLYKRATDAFKNGVLMRSEARVLTGHEATPEDDVYFEDVSIAITQAGDGGDPDRPNADPAEQSDGTEDDASKNPKKD